MTAVEWLEQKIDGTIMKMLLNGLNNLKRNKMKLPFVKYNDRLCECGENKKCVRKIYSNSNGQLWVKKDEHFKCGKVRKQVNDLKEWFKQFKKK